MTMNRQYTGYEKQRIVILSEAKNLRLFFDSAEDAISRDVSLALNMTV
jgi:hypothetical protein